MPAPDLTTLLDFETNIETAATTFLETDTGLTASSLFATLDQDTFVVPRLEVMFEKGEALDPPTPKIANSSQVEYMQHKGVLSIRVVSDASVADTQTTHRQLRGKVRTSMLLNAQNFTTPSGGSTVLPYYEVKYMRPTGTTYEVDGDLAISSLTYDMTIAIKTDAFPEFVFNDAVAIYSLRKFSRYSGDAVRIRRTSDNAEVNVAFDSNDKVSSSSNISLLSGSTTATDLNGFLNEVLDGFIATSYGGIDASYRHFTSDPTISNTAFSGSNGGTQSRLTYQNPFGYLVSASDFDGCKVKVTGTVNTLSGGNITLKPNTQSNGGGSWTPSEGDKVISTIGSFEYIFTGNGTNSFKSVVFLIDASTTVDVSNLTFEVIEHGATVHTLYEQAGSYNAVQDSIPNQPKIAENGALLADGLKFDGIDDMLTNSNVGAMQASDGMSTFTVHKKRVASTSTTFGATNPQYLYHLYETSLDNSVLAHRILGGKLSILRANAAADDFLITRTTNHLIGTTKNLSSAIGSSAFQNHYNATTPSEDIEDTGTSYDSSSTKLSIGSQSGGAGDGRHYDGQIEELIIYNSDQSDNRTIIENNINDYYNIYS